MASYKKILVFLLTCCVLSTCLCSKPIRSRRQKRGIAKMMMHIMWDPVRLIRYWYAYDVTREIAKSWRKIIPTILLLPITQHMPHSYGLAKYVHPTVGIRDYNKSKVKPKYPGISVNSYKGAAVNVKPVALPPTIYHQVYPSRYTDVPQHSEYQYQTSSKESESAAQYDHQNVPHVLLGQAPYDDGKEDSNQYSIAQYFVADDTSREEMPTSDKAVLFPGHEYNIDEDISSSPSQSVTRNSYKKRPHSFPPKNHKPSPFHYVPHVETHGATIRDENGQLTSPILHPGQEFHIVLHPIPINDYNPNSLKPPSDGQAIQFVPVQSQSNQSYDKNSGLSPILFKAISMNIAESDHPHEDRAVDTSNTEDSDSIGSHSNASVNSGEEEKSNTSGEETRHRVTWVPQKNSNLSRRTDKKGSEMQTDGTTKKVVSVHRNTPQKSESNKASSKSFVPKRYSINMDRLREDLKHGTPVLIPFNKNTHSSEELSNTDHENPVSFPHEHLNHSQSSGEQSVKSDVVKDPVISDSSVVNTSSENSGEDNSSQRIVLFLKKRKNS